jgi:diguanylate cyclase (GGDEF)-like protein/PAS domain S-box-containing protein
MSNIAGLLGEMLTNVPSFFGEMFDEINDNVYIIEACKDGSYKYVFANKSAIQDQKIVDVLSAEGQSVLYAMLTDCVRKKEVIHFQETDSTDDGIQVNEIILIPLMLKEENRELTQMIVKDVNKKVERQSITDKLQVKQMTDELELIWNNTNDAIFTIGYDGAVIQANPAFAEILGWSLQEVEGFQRPPFFIEEFSQEDHDKQLELFRIGESLPYFETKRKRKDGTEIEILASYRAVHKDNVLAVAMYKDITEEKKIQKKLEMSEACYRSLVDYSPEAIFVHSNGKLSFANPKAVKLMGAKDRKQMIGKPIWNFIDPKSKNYDSNLIKVFKNQEMIKPDPIIEKLIRFDGTEIWAEVIAIPVEHDGELVIQAIMRDVTERKNYEDQLEYLAFHDPLTGLSNRRSFTENLERSIEEAKVAGEVFAVLYLDMDKFKDINDSLGHEVGDELLKQFAKRMQDNVRTSDVVGRVGGDEFLILLRNIDTNKIKKYVKRMHTAFQKPYSIKGKEITVTSSIGISMYPLNGDSPKILIRNADQALYSAKMRRNQFRFYHQEISWF